MLFELSRAEFGNMISTGIYLPYLLYKSGLDVSAYTSVVFPEKWIADNYPKLLIGNVARGPRQKGDIIDKRSAEEFFFSHYPDSGLFRPMPVNGIPRSNPYVVLIPTVFGHAGNEKTGWRRYHSIEFRFWKQMSEEAKKRGYSVVGFGGSCSCSEQHLREICDEYVYISRDLVTPKNNILYRQLQTMRNAKMCVGIGGTIHLSMCFDVPGLGYDGQIYSNYRRFSKLLAEQRETTLIYMPHGPTFENNVRKKLDLNVPRDPGLDDILRKTPKETAENISAQWNQAVRYYWGQLLVDKFIQSIS